MTELKNGVYSLDEFLELHEAIAEMAIKDKQEMDRIKQD